MESNQQYCVVTSQGELVTLMSGTKSFIEANLHEGQSAILGDKPSTRSYWSFELDEWISIPPAPNSYSRFDYAIKQWVDLRSLDEIKAQRWTEIKSLRDRLEFGGFEFDGGIYDSDQVSQGRIMGAAVAGVDQVWTLADNTTVELSASQLQQLYAALQAHIASVHERGRIARQLIFDAETKEQVEAVQL